MPLISVFSLICEKNALDHLSGIARETCKTSHTFDAPQGAMHWQPVASTCCGCNGLQGKQQLGLFRRNQSADSEAKQT
jgi:hypothetical protein